MSGPSAHPLTILIGVVAEVITLGHLRLLAVASTRGDMRRSLLSVALPRLHPCIPTIAQVMASFKVAAHRLVQHAAEDGRLRRSVSAVFIRADATHRLVTAEAIVKALGLTHVGLLDVGATEGAHPGGTVAERTARTPPRPTAPALQLSRIG